MGKFKYEKYDYSKVGICEANKWSSVYTVETLGDITAYNNDAAKILYEEIKKYYYDKKPNYKYDPNIDWTWELITPVKTYTFK